MARKQKAMPSEQAMTLQALVQDLPVQAWERLCFRLGEKGPIWYDWQAIRVQMKNDTIGEQWLLIQWQISDQPEYMFYLSNAPSDRQLVELEPC